MKSQKSAIEIDMLNCIKKCETIIDDSYLKTKDARRIVDLLVKALGKVEELRISRDNWRNKYEGAKNDKNI